MTRMLLMFTGIACLVSLGNGGRAQTPTCPTAVAPDTVRGNFTLDLGDRFCAGQSVRLTDTRALQNLQYWYEYAGTTVPTTGGSSTPTHRFSTPGKYLIIQRGTLAGRGAYACKVVEVLATPPPVFSAISCTPGQVTITIPDNPSNPYEQYQVSWGVAGSTPLTVTRNQTPATFSYPSQSTLYNVIVSGRYVPGSCGSATIQQIRANGVPPTVQKADLTRLDLGGPTTGTLAMTSFRGGAIEVFQRVAGGTYQTSGEKLSISTAANVVNLKNLNNQSQYCFKAVFNDNCQQKQESAELCSIPLRVTAQNQQNAVEWTAYPTPPAGLTFRDYILSRNGTAYPPVITAIGSTQRTDAPVKCGDAYTYQVTARVGTMTSVSELKTVRGISTTVPPVMTTLVATVSGGGVALTWQAPPAGTPPNDGLRKYTLRRWDDGGQNFQPLLDSTKALRFDDKTAQAASHPVCYAIGYTDICGNQSPISTPTCTVWLQQAKNTLDWTAYRQFAGGETYTVEEVDDNGRVLNTQPAGSGLQLTPDPARLSGQQVRFRVKASGAGANEVSYSNEISYSLAMSVYVPNVFTPNGDGINDAFEIRGLFIQEYKLAIFNRWGEPVFKTDDRREGWNGLVNGTPVPDGQYAYQLDLVDFRGNAFRKRGAVLVAR